MPTHETDGLGSAAKRVADHTRTLVGLEVELAKLELQKKLGALGAAAGLGVAAAVLAVFAVCFALATMALALALVVDPWLATLIMMALLLAVAALLGWLASRMAKRGTPPVPEQAIEEARLTTEAIKAEGNGGT